MNTFWGCETERLTELSAVVVDRAARLRSLMRDVALQARGAAWFGPDAEDHRVRTEDVVEAAVDVIETLRRLGELLDDEAEQQEICSRPDGGAAAGDPLAVRAEPPVDDASDRRPRPPSVRGIDLLPEGIDLPRLYGDRDDPLPIGGPFMREEPWTARPPQGSLPAGEDFSLDPEILAEAERRRKVALGYVPVVGTVQGAMSVHEAIGGVYDEVEQGLEENGLEELTPLVSLARIPHTLSGAVFGEKSVLGQVSSAVDRGVANVSQTGQEFVSEVAEGDAAGAARAAERGLFRHAGVVADAVTATAVPALADTASDMIGIGADMTEPLSPGAAETLRSAEAEVREAGQSWEEQQEALTDPERYYDLRRDVAPMPWDPR